MPAYRAWTIEETNELKRLRKEGLSFKAIGEKLQRPGYSVSNKWARLPEKDKAEDAEEKPLTVKEREKKIAEAAAVAPIDYDAAATIRELESEIARLREQRKWETQSESVKTTGGKFTLRRSDDHHGDENHMLSCAESLTQKTLVLIEEYEPSTIQLIMMDDWIAGKGIFREQDAQMAVAAIEQQIAVGAVKAYRLLDNIRKITDVPIKVLALRGNHEHANKVPVSNALFFECRAFCEEIKDVTWQLHMDRTVVNLAHTGLHNVFVMHGYGHSRISPNSPKFIEDTKDALLQMQRKMQPEEQIRRVLSGHTHYLSVGLERVRGIEWDTTGGLQRNNRVQLGLNNRPSGWIAYISPPDIPNEIRQPLAVKPDPETYDRELADPHLASANKADCAECLEFHKTKLQDSGVLGPGDQFGLVTEGRW